MRGARSMAHLVKVAIITLGVLLPILQLNHSALGQQRIFNRNGPRFIRRYDGSNEISWEGNRVLPPVTTNPVFLQNDPVRRKTSYYFPAKNTAGIPSSEDWNNAQATYGERITTASTTKRSYFPASSNSNNFPQSQEESRPITIDFIRPNLNTRNDENINLNTEYFINKISTDAPTTTTKAAATSTERTTRRKRLTTIPARIPVLVRKIARRPILRPVDDDISSTTTESAAANSLFNVTSKKNYVEDILPASWVPLIDVLRGEIWVVPILVAAGILACLLIIFDVYLLVHTLRSRYSSSRRHLFLGQMLLLGLLLCCGSAVVHTLRPSVIVCSVSRIASGLSYAIVYATLLVKLVFLVSLNGGIYLPTSYQSLLLCFAILIQLVIGIQWLVSEPADVVSKGHDMINTIMAENATTMSPLVPLGADEVIDYLRCNVTFQQQMLGFLYVLFLVTVVVILSFKAKGVRENYREAMYIGLTMGFTVCFFLIWILAGFIAPPEYQDVCISCGLVATAAITFVIMFLPKGRQMSAMGRDGVYAEDRTDVYIGSSSTQSTGSGSLDDHKFGDPSPSFFPIKPTPKQMSQFALKPEKDLHDSAFWDAHRRTRSKSPPKSHHHHNHHHHNHHHQSHTGPDFHENFHNQQRAGHRAIFGFNTSDRYPSRRSRRHNFLSDGDSDTTYSELIQRVRSRSTPTNRRRAGQHAQQAQHNDFARVFSAHDLHAANERRASRKDLADLRNQLFVRSTSHSDLLDRRAAMRSSGRDLLSHWEQQRCKICNSVNTLTPPHHHHVHHNPLLDDERFARPSRY